MNNAPAPEGLEALQTDAASVPQQQARHHAWRVKLAKMDELRVVFLHAADLDQVLRSVECHYPGRPVEYLRPVK